MLESNNDAQIGPQEGRELELLLNGRKTIALFFSDYPFSDQFTPYLEQELLFLHSEMLMSCPNSLSLNAFIISKNKQDSKIN